jgi:hypothetical protein
MFRHTARDECAEALRVDTAMKQNRTKVPRDQSNGVLTQRMLPTTAVGGTGYAPLGRM